MRSGTPTLNISASAHSSETEGLHFDITDALVMRSAQEVDFVLLRVFAKRAVQSSLTYIGIMTL